MVLRSFVITLFLWAALAPGAVRADVPAETLSKGERFDAKTALKPEGTAIVVFIQETSVIEQQFLADIQKATPPTKTVALKVVRLKNTDAPAAQQYQITSTPAAIVFDRFGKVIAKTSQPDEIKAAVRKGMLMARIKWIDEDDPKAPETYGAPAEALKRGLPGIVKTMALRPEAFRMFNIMSQIHFTNGFLTRREHEMIAAYVSSLNRCKF